MSVSLLDLHCELSRLHHAILLELEPFPVDVTIEWRDGTYLAARVEVLKRHKQATIDRLSRGAIHGPYDYRFMVSYSTSDDGDRQIVTAYVDLHHPRQTQTSEPSHG